MQLELNRQYKNSSETIGALSINGTFFCYTLEDKDRGLTSEMTKDEVYQQKVYANTAIPTGEYEMVLSYSNRFKKMLPLLVGVKGFEGIRVHSGNNHTHTEGCILLGLEKSANAVLRSREAMSKFMAIFTKAVKKEKVFIKII